MPLHCRQLRAHGTDSFKSVDPVAVPSTPPHFLPSTPQRPHYPAHTPYRSIKPAAPLMPFDSRPPHTLDCPPNVLAVCRDMLHYLPPPLPSALLYPVPSASPRACPARCPWAGAPLALRWSASDVDLAEEILPPRPVHIGDISRETKRPPRLRQVE